MADFKQIQIPEALLQQYLNSDKDPEMFVLQYISIVRPDPRDLDRIIPLVVTCHSFARDVRDMIRLTEANLPVVLVQKSETELPVLSIISCQSTGITVASLLEVAVPADVEQAAGEKDARAGDKLSKTLPFVKRKLEEIN